MFHSHLEHDCQSRKGIRYTLPAYNLFTFRGTLVHFLHVIPYFPDTKQFKKIVMKPMGPAMFDVGH